MSFAVGVAVAFVSGFQCDSGRELMFFICGATACGLIIRGIMK